LLHAVASAGLAGSRDQGVERSLFAIGRNLQSAIFLPDSILCRKQPIRTLRQPENGSVLSHHHGTILTGGAPAASEV
jgi:hypothetical protein